MGFRGWVLSESGLDKVNKVKASKKQQQVKAGSATLTANYLKNIDLHEYDITPNFEQKAVDIKIGLDIAWLSSKRIVDALALVTGDTDFIPAMKAYSFGVRARDFRHSSLPKTMLVSEQVLSTGNKDLKE